MKRTLFAILLGFLIGATASGALALTLLAQSQGRITVSSVETASITPATFSLNGSPGQTLTPPFSVLNTGNMAQTFTLTLTEACSATPWGASLSPLTLNLAPGDSGVVTLMVRIPDTALGASYCDEAINVSADTASPPPLP